VQVKSVKELYALKTDEELLSLADEKESLTESARLALADELLRRRLPVVSATTPAIDSVEADAQPGVRRRSGSRSVLMWLGLFVLNTIVVYAFAVHLSAMLVGRWFAWIAPIVGFPRGVAPADWYLRHLELVTIIPALLAGYIDAGRFLPATVGMRIGEWRSGSAGTWAWAVPSAVLVYSMLTLHTPSSVLIRPSMSVFKYFFDIVKVSPTLQNPLASDPIRTWAQMSVTAPFYAGVAYSVGVLASKFELVEKFFAFEKHDGESAQQDS
jgi:hypothetical protein